MERNKQDEPYKISDLVLRIAWMYIFMAAGALVIYLLLTAIENHKTTIVISRSYRVPIEREEEVLSGAGGSDT